MFARLKSATGGWQRAASILRSATGPRISTPPTRGRHRLPQPASRIIVSSCASTATRSPTAGPAIWGRARRAIARYSRNHELSTPAKSAPIEGSSDPLFRGDRARYNPEELLVGALSACHMLWALHYCADAGIVVTDYRGRGARRNGGARRRLGRVHARGAAPAYDDHGCGANRGRDRDPWPGPRSVRDRAVGKFFRRM